MDETSETVVKAPKTPFEPKGATPEELALVQGNLAGLTPEQRVNYYRMTCESLGLNPLTRPFDYISLNGKLTLYAKKDAADQLRSLRKVSIQIVARESIEGVYMVTARATMPDGRTDESIGAGALPKDPAERANAIMRAETKAKRRVTLSICGLGMLDETELDTIPRSAYVVGEPSPTPQSPAWLAQPAKTLPPAPAAPDEREARVAAFRAKCWAIFEACSEEVKARIKHVTPATPYGRSTEGLIDTVTEIIKLKGMRASTLVLEEFEAAVLSINP